MFAVFLVGCGSFVGGALRYSIGLALPDLSYWNTLIVNFLGCFIVGALHGWVQQGCFLSPEWRTALIVGFCGGFTTFSTFAWDHLQLLRWGSSGLALLGMFFSLCGGLALAWVGQVLVSR